MILTLSILQIETLYIDCLKVTLKELAQENMKFLESSIQTESPVN